MKAFSIQRIYFLTIWKTTDPGSPAHAMPETAEHTPFDFTFVDAVARIALYDDLKSAPRITKIQPAATDEFIESLTTAVYEQSKLCGGRIPYSVIREVSENFIHARFCEIVVSILDDGNTIRFADQGPGIREKDKAVKPGFSSAIEPMKDYIRGVGSGFPIVKDYLDDRDGSIIIEDNLVTGAVVTITLMAQATPVASEVPSRPAPVAAFVPHIPLTEREQQVLLMLAQEGDLGVTDLHELTGLAVSSVHNVLRKLEESALVEKSVGKKRTLTDLGQTLASTL